MQINESISISISPESIWDFWLLVETDAQWRGGIIKAEWTSKPPYGLSSTGVHYGRGIGAMSWKVIEWEEGRYFEFIHTEGRLQGSVASYHVVPENGGSLVSIKAKMKGPFIMRVFLPFMKGKMTKGIKEDLKKLKNLMEKL